VELRPGITGFRHVNDAAIPKSDLKEFSEHCHTAARMIGATVRAVQPSFAVSTNFARALFQTKHELATILLNCHFPIIAFASPIEIGDMKVNFHDVPQLTEAFDNFNVYELLSVTEANRRLTADDLSHLSPAEQRQVRNWRPKTIGEVIFNFWD